MSKRGMGDDWDRQRGTPPDQGFAADPNAGNPFATSNFGGPSTAGRKILNPKRLRGTRPVTPQPQAQAQPIAANTQNFGFTFGGGPAPAAPSSGFDFGSQQPSAVNFGSQPAPAPMFQPSAFSNQPAASNPFQTNPANATQTSSPAGFQGSIFNIQPTNTAAPAPFSPFGGFGNQSNSQPSSSMFGAPQTQQPKPDFAFGQPASSNTGFGNGAQSVSAPSSFSFGNNNNTTSMGQANTAASPAPFAFAASTQQSTTPSIFSNTTPASPITFGASAPAPQNSSTFSASQAAASEQQPAVAPNTTASQPGSMFSFGAKPSAFQNAFAAVTNPQTEEKPKTPSFNFGASTAASAPSIFSTTATTGPAPGASLFKPAESSGPAATNIFASASSKPSSTTAAFDTSTKQDSAKPSASIFSAESSKAQQKALPTFSFDSSKVGATSSPFSQNATVQTDAGKPKQSGLFSAATPSAFQFQPSQNTSGSSAIAQEAKDKTKPMFTVNAGSSAAQSSPAKPLFSVAGSSAPIMFGQPPTSAPEKTAPTDPASSTPAKPMFSLQNTAVPGGSVFGTAVSEQKPQVPAPQAKPMFGISSSSTSNPEAKPKPSFVFQPSAAKAAEPAVVKTPFSFVPAASVQQQTNLDKPSAVSASSTSQQQQQTKDNSAATSTTKATPQVPTPSETISTPQDEDTTPADASINMSDGSQAPDDATIPESFVAKWTQLRSDDLPTDEVVDILLHDWILQLEIPKSALAGLDMNQEDEITWLWQQSAVDAAWEYHIRTWGSKDRNLLEIYRLIMTLKTELDRFHKKTWRKSDTIVKNPKIFEERYIRKMAKKNIETWETGLKSEIKNLKKRKIDTTRDGDKDEVASANNAKRSKTTGDASNSGVASVPSFQPPPQRNTGNDAPKTFGGFGGKSQADSNAKNATTPAGNMFGAIKPSLNQESPSKVNLFNSSTRAAEDTSSPQRSKTSQLFASIANKPVENVPVKTAPTTAGKSLFDRITRDSTGAPVREVPEVPEEQLFVPQDDDDDVQGSEEHDEEESQEDEEVEGEEDAAEPGGESQNDSNSEDAEDDDESNQAVTTAPSKPVNIFAQSSAKAGATETSPNASLDHTWKPDSPIKFGKDTNTTATPPKPIVGFVPKGGMPKATATATTMVPTSQDTWKALSNPFGNFKNINTKTDSEKKMDTETKAAPETAVSSTKPVMGFVPKGGMPKATAESVVPTTQNTWKAPSNPFGNFKDINTKPDTEKKAEVEIKAAPTFSMPKPPAGSASTAGFTVSTHDTWKAPSDPFGNFKKISNDSATTSSTTPALTITAPSPQRPSKPLFDMAPSSTTAKPIFSFINAQPASGEQSTQPTNLFSSGSDSSVKITSESTESTAPKKLLFDFTKSEPSNTDPPLPPISNHWLDFAKGINKPSSPAPSGASVFASLTTSLNPSRASSPAMSAVSTNAGETDAEHHDDDEAPKEAQLDLINTTAGEENEEALQIVRAKAFEFYSIGDAPKTWNVRGVGELRVLKHKETGKVRAVLRADQSAKVLLNAGLIPSANYGLKTPKRVDFTVAGADGVPTAWFIQVGKEEDAMKLSELFEANKSN